jgi:hypothetical protein
MHLLPFQLGAVANLTDRRDSTRFALSNVNLRLYGDNTFCAESTDSKRLIRVTGPCAEPDEYPSGGIPGFDAAPNGALAALVPGDVWKKTFSAAGKLVSARAFKQKPILGNVAVKVGDKVTTFGATNLERHLTESVSNGTGRYPPTGDILGQCQKHNRDVFSVDPVLLAEVLRTLAEFTDEENKRVTFSVGRKCKKTDTDKPILIRVDTAVGGMRVESVVMPLAGDNAPDQGTAELATDGPDPSTEPAHLAELTELRAELAAARAALEQSEYLRDVAGGEIATLRAELANLRAGSPDGSGPPPAVAPAELAELETSLTQSRAELAARESELAETRAQLDQVSRNLMVVEHNTREIVNDRDAIQFENARLVNRITSGLATVPPVSPTAVPPVPVPPAGSPGSPRPLTRAERIALLRTGSPG